MSELISGHQGIRNALIFVEIIATSAAATLFLK